MDKYLLIAFLLAVIILPYHALAASCGDFNCSGATTYSLNGGQRTYVDVPGYGVYGTNIPMEFYWFSSLGGNVSLMINFCTNTVGIGKGSNCGYPYYISSITPVSESQQSLNTMTIELGENERSCPVDCGASPRVCVRNMQLGSFKGEFNSSETIEIVVTLNSTAGNPMASIPINMKIYDYSGSSANITSAYQTNSTGSYRFTTNYENHGTTSKTYMFEFSTANNVPDQGCYGTSSSIIFRVKPQVTGPRSCNDTDGGIRPFAKGTATDVSGSYMDYCLIFNGTGGHQVNECYNLQDSNWCSLKEASCNPDNVSGFWPEGSSTPCEYGCRNGACIQPTSTCFDSDSGINYNVKGTSFDGSSGHCFDSCSGSTLTECGCSNNQVTRNIYTCPNGCNNGVCFPTCTETDNGRDFYKKSTTKGSNGTFTDYCDGNNVMEYSCIYGGIVDVYRYPCSNGCQNGKCIQGEVEPSCGDETCDGATTIMLYGGSSTNITVYGKRHNITLLGVTQSGSAVVNIDNGTTESMSKSNNRVYSYPFPNPVYLNDADFISANNQNLNYAILTFGENPTTCASDCKGTTCTDSDNGADFSVKGAASGTNGNFTDYCRNSTWLYEFSCAGSGLVQKTLQMCQYGCSGGICNPEPGSNCGNGVIDSGEQCDCGQTTGCTPAQLGGSTCASLGFQSGTLGCLQEGENECMFSTDGCVSVPAGNEKLMSKYLSNEVFLASDSDWRTVLPLVPLTTWTGTETNCNRGTGTPSDVCAYPLLVYHDEGKSDSIDVAPGDFDVQAAGYSYDFERTFTLNTTRLNLNDAIKVHASVTNKLDQEVNVIAVYMNKYHEGLSVVSQGYFLNQVFAPGETKEYEFILVFKGYWPYDADSVIHFMQQYSPEKVTIIGQTPQELDDLIASYPNNEVGAGMRADQCQRRSINDYLTYWGNYDDVVYVEDNYEKALLASTYASLINAPLIIKGHEPSGLVLDGKNVICIGNPGIGCNEHYTIEELQQKYATETGTDKILLVNPSDWNIKLNDAFKPEKSTITSKEAYGKASLSAPILASAKHELLLTYPTSGIDPSTEAGIADKISAIDSFLSGRFGALFIPNYFTIVASHMAIPDSTGIEIPYYGQYRTVVDWKYASADNTDHSTAKVGRILGLSSSDVSGYIGRSIFYGKIFTNMYPDSRFKILSIGHSFSTSAREAEDVISKASAIGYEGKCYNDIDSSVCVRGTYIQPGDIPLRQIVSYSDHGSPTEWYGTMKSNYIEDIDASFIIAHACLTNNFWLGGAKNLGVNIIRKGSVGYISAAGITFGTGGLCSDDGTTYCAFDSDCRRVNPSSTAICLPGPMPGSTAMNYITSNGNIPLGLLLNSLMNDQALNRQYDYSHANLLLGDPTLVPRWKI